MKIHLVFAEIWASMWKNALSPKQSFLIYKHICGEIFTMIRSVVFT